VEFFNGTTSLGVDTTAPYSVSWNPPAAGNFTLLARATDSQGAVGTSAPASISVVAPIPGKVVISQIYASGGRWWSDYSNDFVELYNSGSAPVSLAGWSLQFTGGTGSKWTVLPLKGRIPAKGFYLVALAGGGYSYDLPAADATGAVDLAVKQGKLALLRATTPVSGTSPAEIPRWRISLDTVPLMHGRVTIPPFPRKDGMPSSAWTARIPTTTTGTSIGITHILATQNPRQPSGSREGNRHEKKRRAFGPPLLGPSEI
jgi:hypothetical protein